MTAPAAPRPLVVASNRGPVTFVRQDGAVVARRGGGGLVSALAPLVSGTDAVWIAGAMSPEDAARAGSLVTAEDVQLRFVDVPAATYRAAYDVVCNATLWFVHHGLFDLPRRPRFDGHWRQAWDAYRATNEAFARTIASDAPPDAVVLLHDYHLLLCAPALRAARPDLALVHFTHTPFASPDGFAVLPNDVAREILVGLGAHDACGFHTARWAGAFSACCEAHGLTPPHTFVAPVAADADALRATAASPAVVEARRHLETRVAGRRTVVRVDRIELSKNIVRGFLAYDDLLERFPAWRGETVFLAAVYPSREGLPEYLAYRQEVEAAAAHVNRRWGTADWTPVLLDTDDDYPRSVAALCSYDVLLVNPIRDGFNLVALEGPLLNDRDGVLLLSPEAGAWSELASDAWPVHPFDIRGTADALDRALRLDARSRATLAGRLRTRAAARSPADWLAALRRAAAVGEPPIG